MMPPHLWPRASAARSASRLTAAHCTRNGRLRAISPFRCLSVVVARRHRVRRELELPLPDLRQRGHGAGDRLRREPAARRV